MCRRDDDQTMQIALSPEEWDAVNTIKAAGGFTSDANTVRSALWRLGTEMGLDFARGVFDQRRTRGFTVEDARKGGRARAAAVRVQPVTGRPKKLKVRPARNHPWRQYREPKADA